MFKRVIASLVFIAFTVNLILPYGKVWAAEPALNLPVPGTMVSLSPAYEPLLIKGVTVHKDNPFMFDFVVDAGHSGLETGNGRDQSLRQEADRLIKYFFACLTIPEKDLWVNLSPYEKGRMAPEALGQTALGRDLLAQDYILKQLTASLIYPEKELGREFWNRIYAKAQQLYGTSEIPVNTFNKVWILADKATVYEHGQTAFVVDGHLKVMLEEDYLAASKQLPLTPSLEKRGKEAASPLFTKEGTKGSSNNALGSQIIRELILPELEKEVNQGKNFAPLRQIFNSLILANWYKKNLKDALLTQVYADKSTVKGIQRSGVIASGAKQSQQDLTPEQIYEQYLKAYKKGVFNYIKEDPSAGSGQVTPKKYFSGGFAVNDQLTTVINDQAPQAPSTKQSLMNRFILPILISAVTLFNSATSALDQGNELSPGLSQPLQIIDTAMDARDQQNLLNVLGMEERELIAFSQSLSGYKFMAGTEFNQFTPKEEKEFAIRIEGPFDQAKPKKDQIVFQYEHAGKQVSLIFSKNNLNGVLFRLLRKGVRITPFIQSLERQLIARKREKKELAAWLLEANRRARADAIESIKYGTWFDIKKIRHLEQYLGRLNMFEDTIKEVLNGWVEAGLLDKSRDGLEFMFNSRSLKAFQKIFDAAMDADAVMEPVFVLPGWEEAAPTEENAQVIAYIKGIIAKHPMNIPHVENLSYKGMKWHRIKDMVKKKSIQNPLRLILRNDQSRVFHYNGTEDLSKALGRVVEDGPAYEWNEIKVRDQTKYYWFIQSQEDGETRCIIFDVAMGAKLDTHSPFSSIQGLTVPGFENDRVSIRQFFADYMADPNFRGIIPPKEIEEFNKVVAKLNPQEFERKLVTAFSKSLHPLLGVKATIQELSTDDTLWRYMRMVVGQIKNTNGVRIETLRGRLQAVYREQFLCFMYLLTQSEEGFMLKLFESEPLQVITFREVVQPLASFQLKENIGRTHIFTNGYSLVNAEETFKYSLLSPAKKVLVSAEYPKAVGDYRKVLLDMGVSDRSMAVSVPAVVRNSYQVEALPTDAGIALDSGDVAWKVTRNDGLQRIIVHNPRKESVRVLKPNGEPVKHVFDHWNSGWNIGTEGESLNKHVTTFEFLGNPVKFVRIAEGREIPIEDFIYPLVDVQTFSMEKQATVKYAEDKTSSVQLIKQEDQILIQVDEKQTILENAGAQVEGYVVGKRWILIYFNQKVHSYFLNDTGELEVLPTVGLFDKVESFKVDLERNAFVIGGAYLSFNNIYPDSLRLADVAMDASLTLSEQPSTAEALWSTTISPFEIKYSAPHTFGALRDKMQDDTNDIKIPAGSQITFRAVGDFEIVQGENPPIRIFARQNGNLRYQGQEYKSISNAQMHVGIDSNHVITVSHHPNSTEDLIVRPIFMTIEEAQKILIGKKVLVIDDNHQLVKLSVKWLLKAQMSPTTAFTGEEAVQKFKEESFDAVVTDMDLPRPNGKELIEIFRQKNPNLPVVALSGRDHQEDFETVKALFFQKPLDYNIVISALAYQFQDQMMQVSLTTEDVGKLIAQTHSITELTGWLDRTEIPYETIEGKKILGQIKREQTSDIYDGQDGKRMFIARDIIKKVSLLSVLVVIGQHQIYYDKVISSADKEAMVALLQAGISLEDLQHYVSFLPRLLEDGDLRHTSQRFWTIASKFKMMGVAYDLDYLGKMVEVMQENQQLIKAEGVKVKIRTTKAKFEQESLMTNYPGQIIVSAGERSITLLPVADLPVKLNKTATTAPLTVKYQIQGHPLVKLDVQLSPNQIQQTVTWTAQLTNPVPAYVLELLGDKASVGTASEAFPGGIDLTLSQAGLTIQKDSKGGVQVNFDKSLLARIQNEGVQSLLPVIVNIKSLTKADIQQFLI